MKIIKKIIAILCALCMTASLAACNNAEEERHNALMQEISNLSQQITSLNQQINSLTGELETLKEQEAAEKEALTEQLEAQIEKVELMQKKLENLTGVPIEFTEEKPLYGRREMEETIASFDVSNPPEGVFDYDAFGAFKSYVQNDLGKLTPDIFYFLDPGDGEIGWRFLNKSYNITVEKIAEDGTLISPMIHEKMMIYDEVLGIENNLKYEGEQSSFAFSIYLNVFFCPLPQDFIGYLNNIHLEFGDNRAIVDVFGNKYFNIYLNKTCIGTCYYLTNAYVSKTWFENYIYKNLLRSN